MAVYNQNCSYRCHAMAMAMSGTVAVAMEVNIVDVDMAMQCMSLCLYLYLTIANVPTSCPISRNVHITNKLYVYELYNGPCSHVP